MKWIFTLMLLFPRSEAQVPEASSQVCRWSPLTVAFFNRGTLRDEAARVLSNTVGVLARLGMSEDQICKNGVYIRARELYERIALEQEQAAAAAKVKYSSRESSL